MSHPASQAILLVSLVLLPLAIYAVEINSKPDSAAASNATYSNLTSEDLSSLPLSERTVAGALRLCQEKSPGEFCAWLRVDPDTELVSGGACFNEAKHSCNKIGYTGSKNNRRAYRYLTCGGCDSCASEKATSNCDTPDSNCTLLCYCSCGQRLLSGGSSSDSSASYNTTIGDNWHFAYPCTGVCDKNYNCPGYEDENALMCDHLYSTDIKWSWDAFVKMFERPQIKILTAFLVLCLPVMVLLMLNKKYRWLPWMLKHPPPPRSSADSALLAQQQSANT
ncbi:hypothetical protein BOX15_Mlig033761g3 [Macrostomum lignano]|uniref:Uncharacterized protein n=1 Tax=Macrostomum lignano TaxID=282301 RepID=A0A267FKY4_9PLAT|nr:hypothetical protein BOX15_Mlig033761g3 [Macrostomum lignano]